MLPSSARKERREASRGGYTAGAVDSMSVPGVGEVVYNKAEEVKQFPGMKQPAIMPPKRSRAGGRYKDAFSKKHGFDPYAAKGLVPNFIGDPVMDTFNIVKEDLAHALRLGDPGAAKMVLQMAKSSVGASPGSSGVLKIIDNLLMQLSNASGSELSSMFGGKNDDQVLSQLAGMGKKGRKRDRVLNNAGGFIPNFAELYKTRNFSTADYSIFYKTPLDVVDRTLGTMGKMTPETKKNHGLRNRRSNQQRLLEAGHSPEQLFAEDYPITSHNIEDGILRGLLKGDVTALRARSGKFKNFVKSADTLNMRRYGGRKSTTEEWLKTAPPLATDLGNAYEIPSKAFEARLEGQTWPIGEFHHLAGLKPGKSYDSKKFMSNINAVRDFKGMAEGLVNSGDTSNDWMGKSLGQQRGLLSTRGQGLIPNFAKAKGKVRSKEERLQGREILDAELRVAAAKRVGETRVPGGLIGEQHLLRKDGKWISGKGNQAHSELMAAEMKRHKKQREALVEKGDFDNPGVKPFDRADYKEVVNMGADGIFVRGRKSNQKRMKNILTTQERQALRDMGARMGVRVTHDHKSFGEGQARGDGGLRNLGDTVYDPDASGGFVPNFATLSGDILRLNQSKMHLYANPREAKPGGDAVRNAMKALVDSGKPVTVSATTDKLLKGEGGSHTKAIKGLIRYIADQEGGPKLFERDFKLTNLPWKGRKGEEAAEDAVAKALNKDGKKYINTGKRPGAHGDKTFPVDLIGEGLDPVEVKSGEWKQPNILLKSMRLYSDDELMKFAERQYGATPEMLTGARMEKLGKSARLLQGKGLLDKDASLEEQHEAAMKYRIAGGFVPNFLNDLSPRGQSSTLEKIQGWIDRIDDLELEDNISQVGLAKIWGVKPRKIGQHIKGIAPRGKSIGPNSLFKRLQDHYNKKGDSKLQKLREALEKETPTDQSVTPPIAGSVPPDIIKANEFKNIYWDPQDTLSKGPTPLSSIVDKEGALSLRAGATNYPLPAFKDTAGYDLSKDIANWTAGKQTGMAAVWAGLGNPEYKADIDPYYPAINTTGADGKTVKNLLNNTDLKRAGMNWKTFEKIVPKALGKLNPGPNAPLDFREPGGEAKFTTGGVDSPANFVYPQLLGKGLRAEIGSRLSNFANISNFQTALAGRALKDIRLFIPAAAQGLIPNFAGSRSGETTLYRGTSPKYEKEIPDRPNPPQFLFEKVLNAQTKIGFLEAAEELSIQHAKGKYSGSYNQGSRAATLEELRGPNVLGPGEVQHAGLVYKRPIKGKKQKTMPSGFVSKTKNPSVADRFSRALEDTFEGIVRGPQNPDLKGQIDEDTIPNRRILNKEALGRLVDHVGLSSLQKGFKKMMEEGTLNALYLDLHRWKPESEAWGNYRNIGHSGEGMTFDEEEVVQIWDKHSPYYGAAEGLIPNFNMENYARQVTNRRLPNWDGDLSGSVLNHRGSQIDWIRSNKKGEGHELFNSFLNEKGLVQSDSINQTRSFKQGSKTNFEDLVYAFPQLQYRLKSNATTTGDFTHGPEREHFTFRGLKSLKSRVNPMNREGFQSALGAFPGSPGLETITIDDLVTTITKDKSKADDIYKNYAGGYIPNFVRWSPNSKGGSPIPAPDLDPVDGKPRSIYSGADVQEMRSKGYAYSDSKGWHYKGQAKGIGLAKTENNIKHMSGVAEPVSIRYLNSIKEFDRSKKSFLGWGQPGGDDRFSNLEELGSDMIKREVENALIIGYDSRQNMLQLIEGNHRLAAINEKNVAGENYSTLPAYVSGTSIRGGNYGDGADYLKGITNRKGEPSRLPTEVEKYIRESESSGRPIGTIQGRWKPSEFGIPNFADERTRKQKISDVLGDPSNAGINFKGGVLKPRSIKSKNMFQKMWLESYFKEGLEGDYQMLMKMGYDPDTLLSLRSHVEKGGEVNISGKGFVPNFLNSNAPSQPGITQGLKNNDRAAGRVDSLKEQFAKWIKGRISSLNTTEKAALMGAQLIPGGSMASGSYLLVKELWKKWQNEDITRPAELNGLGLVPNFANPLKEAIAREAGAGIPKSQIKVEQSGQLRGPGNPMGLAVTNTRDEPLGVSQGIRRARSMGIDPKTHGTSLGLIPNFADGPKEVFALPTVLTQGMESGMNRLADAIEAAYDSDIAGAMDEAVKQLRDHLGARDDIEFEKAGIEEIVSTLRANLDPTKGVDDKLPPKVAIEELNEKIAERKQLDPEGNDDKNTALIQSLEEFRDSLEKLDKAMETKEAGVQKTPGMREKPSNHLPVLLCGKRRHEGVKYGQIARVETNKGISQGARPRKKSTTREHRGSWRISKKHRAKLRRN